MSTRTDLRRTQERATEALSSVSTGNTSPSKKRCTRGELLRNVGVWINDNLRRNVAPTCSVGSENAKRRSGASMGAGSRQPEIGPFVPLSLDAGRETLVSGAVARLILFGRGSASAWVCTVKIKSEELA